MAGLSWGIRKQFFEQAAAQMENGLTVTALLENFRNRLARQRRRKAAALFGEINKQVRDGRTLTEAMTPYMTDIEIGLLSAGEKAGKTAQSMRFIVDTKERERRIVSKIRSSMLNPLVYMITAFIVLYIIGSSIVPQFAQIVPASRWRGTAGLMRDMGAFATGWDMPIFIAALIILVAVIWRAMPRWTGRARDFFDKKVFPFTVYKETQGVTWLIAFISMIKSGVADVSAIEDQIRTANPWLASRLVPVKASMRNGDNLFVALNNLGINFPSESLIEEIGAYVAFPDFSEKLGNVVVTYMENFEKKMTVMGQAVSALFTVGMFGMFLIIQMGANELSSMAASSVSG